MNNILQYGLMGLFLPCRKEYTSCHLEVDSSVHPDAGVYKVTLENKLGSASATINVKVIGNHSHTLSPTSSTCRLVFNV